MNSIRKTTNKNKMRIKIHTTIVRVSSSFGIILRISSVGLKKREERKG